MRLIHSESEVEEAYNTARSESMNEEIGRAHV